MTQGILLTMYDTRLRLSNQVIEEVKIHFQQLVFDTIIHRNTQTGEAQAMAKQLSCMMQVVREPLII